MTSRDPKAAVR